jgi:acyl-CoA thioesterase-2
MSNQMADTMSALIELFDVQPLSSGGFTAPSTSGEAHRQVVEGGQLLAQAIVAVAKHLPDKSVRSAHGVFARMVVVGSEVRFDVDVVSSGRTTATAVVSVIQNERRCAVVTVLADVPSADVLRHESPCPDVSGPADANFSPWPLEGVELRLVDVTDVSSPDEVGPPELYAWWRFDPKPASPDLAKAVIAYFAGQFGIATTMRAHKGIGMSHAHATVSTAPMVTMVSFHEPVGWQDWVLCSNESIQVGAGMSYVRGVVHSAGGDLIASFVQESLIRPMRPTDGAVAAAARF